MKWLLPLRLIKLFASRLFKIARGMGCERMNWFKPLLTLNQNTSLYQMSSKVASCSLSIQTQNRQTSLDRFRITFWVESESLYIINFELFFNFWFEFSQRKFHPKNKKFRRCTIRRSAFIIWPDHLTWWKDHSIWWNQNDLPNQGFNSWMEEKKNYRTIRPGIILFTSRIEMKF